MPKTKNDERIEEIANEFTKWHSAETTFAYGVPNDKTIADWWIEMLHQELQKARQSWLREEIVKLEGRLIPVPKMELSPYTTDYQIMMDSGFRLSDAKLYNQALQTIIDRYQSELDQPK